MISLNYGPTYLRSYFRYYLYYLRYSSVDSVLFLSPLLSYSIKFDFKNYLLLLVYNNLVFPFSSLFFLSFSSYNNLLLIILFFIASFFFFQSKVISYTFNCVAIFFFFQSKKFFYDFNNVILSLSIFSKLFFPLRHKKGVLRPKIPCKFFSWAFCCLNYSLFIMMRKNFYMNFSGFQMTFKTILRNL